MALNTDLRLKLKHFWDKYNKIIILIVVILVIIITVNRILVMNKTPDVPQTSYVPHTTVLDSSEDVPKKIVTSFEEFIDKYVEYCNTGDYVNAYNMISDDCKINFFGNSYNNFVEYVSAKFGLGRKYAIQSYSNSNNKYIYSVKIFDDFLATGLTNQGYRYVEEKMIASYDKDGNVVFSVGNYIQSQKVAFQASNDYLKAEIIKSVEKYSFVIYNLKLTNRTDYTIVVKDGYAPETEVLMKIGNETRGCSEEDNIILAPGETKTVSISFSKFYDSDEIPEAIVLNAIRVMENYTGNEETIEEEINNAIDKFSMTISLK